LKLNLVAVVTMDKYLIIKKKTGIVLTTINIPRKLTNAKLQQKRTHNLRKKTQRTVQSK
jgi:hypothetical protein